MQDLFTAPASQMHKALRDAADAGPVMTHPLSGATVVLRYADIDALARDPRLAGVGLVLFDLMGISSGPLRDWYGSLMFTNEGEYHDRLRTLVSRAFSPRKVEALRDGAKQLVDEAFDNVADGGDLIAAFASVSTRVMCRLLGVPEQDMARFGAWGDALSPIFGVMDPQQIDAATTALVDLLAYIGDLTERRRSEPADDLITALLAAEDDGDKLTHDEAVTMVANLLVAGHDTTTSQVGCSLLTLLTHPDEAARVAKDPSLLVSATEETIRFQPSIAGVPRTALEPVEVAGTTMQPGSLVILATAAANREPGTWHDPDAVDVARFTDKSAPKLLSFGAGPHFCLGAALARMTLQEVVRGTCDRIDQMRLVTADVPWRVVLGRSPARLGVQPC